MKILFALISIFIATSASAQSIGILDAFGKTNTKKGATHNIGSFISTEKGEVSAYFAWQGLSIILNQKTTLVLSKVELCNYGGRQSFWAVLNGSVIVQKNHFSNPCSKAVFATNKGIVRLAGTKGQISDNGDLMTAGVSEGVMILENELGSIDISNGQYGTVAEGEAPKGPFPIDWSAIRPTVQYRERANIWSPAGIESTDMTVTAPNGERRTCRLLPHRQLRCG